MMNTTENPTQNSEPTPPSRTKAEEITALLRDEILRGQYRAGERMPSERDLAARFDANRGSIREALKKLEQLGIASITPGGVRVIPVEEASLSILGPLVDLQELPDPNMVSHLLEVLGALLSLAAKTSMQKASDDQVQQMRTIVQELQDHCDNAEYQNQCWRALGQLFTEISDNLVLRLILNGLKAQFIDRLDERPHLALKINLNERSEILQRLANAIELRDANAVSNAILEHFEMVNNTIRIALNQPAAPQRSTLL